MKMLKLDTDACSPDDFDVRWETGAMFNLGSIPCKVISTPGHTPDSISYIIGDSIFCGDSVFYPYILLTPATSAPPAAISQMAVHHFYTRALMIFILFRTGLKYSLVTITLQRAATPLSSRPLAKRND